MPQAHQLVQTLSPGDAISSHARALQRCLQQKGYASEIFAERLHPEALSLGQPIEAFRARSGWQAEDLLLYHYSLDSPLARDFASFPGKRILDYHNVTPERFLIGHHPELVEFLARGRDRLGDLRDCTDLGLADSDYNRRELDDLGFSPTATLPVFVDLERLQVPPEPLLLHQFRAGLEKSPPTILFVGRVIPNKGQDAVLRAFAAYQRHFEPEARLLLTGEFRSIESYNHELLHLAKAWQVQNVHFLGHVTDAQLAACYQLADVFLCLSRHEGFGVPLLEAFAFDVPVVALAEAAVPGTLGGAGLLVEEDDPFLLAELLDAVVRDQNLRQSVLRLQRARLTQFEHPHLAQQFFDALESIGCVLPLPEEALPSSPVPSEEVL